MFLLPQSAMGPCLSTHLALVLFLSKLSCIQQSDVGLFPTESSIISGTISYVRKGHGLTVECTTDYDDQKYVMARYQWMDHLNRGAARLGFTLFGNGSLEVNGAVLSDTDTYTCSIFMPNGSIEKYTQTIIVYSMAAYYMQYPFEYYVSSCNAEINLFKMEDLQEFVCRKYLTNCPFRFSTKCEATKENSFMLTVYVNQYPVGNYEPPICDITCMKNSLLLYISTVGHDIISNLTAEERYYQRPIFGSIRFASNPITRAQIEASCPGGYEIYDDILCVPCFPSYYAKSDSPTSNSTSGCLRCPNGQYQDKFGREDCFPCPGFDELKSKGPITIEQCEAKAWKKPSKLVFIGILTGCITASVLTTVLIIICCVRICQKRNLLREDILESGVERVSTPSGEVLCKRIRRPK